MKPQNEGEEMREEGGKEGGKEGEEGTYKHRRPPDHHPLHPSSRQSPG